MAHSHIDENNDGKCDKCGVEMCEKQEMQGAQTLTCSRVQGHKGQHYDRRNKTHF